MRLKTINLIHRRAVGWSALAVAALAVTVRAEPAELPGSAQVIATPATQPTTAPAQPADRSAEVPRRSAWSTTVSSFANALVDASEAETVTQLLSEDVVVRQFNVSQRQDPTQFRESMLGMKLITSRGYLDTPMTLAADIAADVKDVELPDEVKRRLTPADNEAVKRANLTANKWIGTSLLTAGGDPVAVIVLWHEATTHPAEHDPAAASNQDDDNAKPAPLVKLPVFVLLKGELIEGRYRIRQICYGDPLPLAAATATADVGR